MASRNKIPETLERVCDEFSKLPGIGKKTASRLAFYIMNLPREEALRLSESIEALVENVRFCSKCFNITESDPCPVCSDPGRDQEVMVVVEEPNDMFAIEDIGEYHGLYHILGGAIAPLDGVEPEDLHIRELIERIREGTIREVIIATNPNAEGDVTSVYISKLLKPLGVKVTRIARGLPTGSDLEFADKTTLKKALEGRTEE
ncbi:recombination protein RecR [bacterium]|nr:recombination protein RecR [bacterium]